MKNRPQPLAAMLKTAQSNGYAVGAFNCRYQPMIQAVLEAAEETRSPVCVQISQREIEWFSVDVSAFVGEVLRVVDACDITIPYSIHLDHSWDRTLFEQVIAAGFTSVMIDASAKPLADNIAATREIVELALPLGISVEAELGRIFSTDKLETDSDSTLYTDPDEAAQFVEQSGCDSLAVSIGSAHGVYQVKNPKIHMDRLREIRKKVSLPLVLHGGTGLPEETVRQAIHIEEGGISKLNIATELELCLLETLGLPERLSAQQIAALSTAQVEAARIQIRSLVMEKMTAFLGSAGQAQKKKEKV